MELKIAYSKQVDAMQCFAVVADSIKDVRDLFSEKELKYISAKRDAKQSLVIIDRLESLVACVFPDTATKEWRMLEKMRVNGNDVLKKYIAAGYCAFQLVDRTATQGLFCACAEGIVLGSYRFDKYKTLGNRDGKKLAEIVFCDADSHKEKLSEIIVLADAVFLARNWVNEPVIELGAPEFADQLKLFGEQAGLRVDVKDKKWIESENMSGLLAVNKGSVDEPRFTILEWKPDGAKNANPFVFVGKGIVFDTGGISLKPSSFMEWMKSDMGGAAAIAGAMIAIAKNNLPLHVVALIPSTDNRPSGNAYVPGDVIRMRNGKTVEVLNTDAEGRMILADGLTYADGLNPEMVVDVATLTGAAANAVADFAVVAMGTADDSAFEVLEHSGYAQCERVVRFPFWEEYGDMITSDIADIKNVGGPVAGAITAGKFLEHFVRSPWVHIDISGSAFLKVESSYRGKGGSGFGVRLLYDFVCRHYRLK